MSIESLNIFSSRQEDPKDQEDNEEQESHSLYDLRVYKKELKNIFKALSIADEQKQLDRPTDPSVVTAFGEVIKEKLTVVFEPKREAVASLIDTLCEDSYMTNKDMIDEFATAIWRFAKDNFSLAELENRAVEANLEVNPHLIHLNRLVNYEKIDHEVKLHIMYATTVPIGEKIRLVKEAFHDLAIRLQNDPELADIEIISGTSWIFKKNPGLAKRLGFTLDDSVEVKSTELRAIMKKEDFTSLYS